MLQVFPDCQYMPQLWRYSPTKLYDGAQMANFWRFLRPETCCMRIAEIQYFSDPHASRFTPMHSRIALRPHHVWKYCIHPICHG